MPETAKKRSKSCWTTVALGDVVDIINDYWDRDTTNPERLVAGEHIDEGALQVRRWAMTDDALIPPTFNRWFQAGDVLLHSRNIKKVARPGFRGITGEKIFILRSKNESVLLQALVPFLVQSNVFRGYAESRWAGSTNKFLNKKPLEEFEFALPPIEEQRRMVAVLSAARTTAEALSATEASLDVVYESWVEARLTGHDWPERPASDLLDRATVGIVVKPAALYVERGGVPALRSLNVLPNRISWDDCVQISEPAHEAHHKSALRAGDVVIVRSGRPGDAAVIPAHDRGLNAIDLIVSTPGPHLRSGFFCRFLNSRAGRRQFASGIAGTAQLHFNVSLFKKLMVPVPPLREQAAFEQEAERFDVAITQIETRIRELKTLREALLEECVRR